MNSETLTNRDDLRLARRCVSGDMQALEVLFDEYVEVVHRAAYRITGHPDEAEDVVQDVFLGLPRALKSYNGSGALDAWIRRVAINTALMHLRRSKNRRIEEHTAPHVRSPSDATLAGIDVERALEKLDSGLRIVFVLKEGEGLEHKEIAQLLGISKAASKMRLSRARAELRRILTDRSSR